MDGTGLPGRWGTCDEAGLNRISDRIPDHALFSGLAAADRLSWLAYFYAFPRNPGPAVLNLRQHAISLYDPFARRSVFPAGRRFCINTYTGCTHKCRYCYIKGYIPDAFRVRRKKNLRRMFLKDLTEIENLNLHPVPVHISNSTDPLQPLEHQVQDTLFILQQLVKKQHLFSRIIILTKNPMLLCGRKYLPVVKALGSLTVEVSCAFFDESSRRIMEPFSPTLSSRMAGITKLRSAGLSVSLRLDPLFPRNPLPPIFSNPDGISTYGIEEIQTLAEIKQLVAFAAESGCKRIIASPLKITSDRFGGSGDPVMDNYQKLYQGAEKGQTIKRGNSYRLVREYSRQLLADLKQIAAEKKIKVLHCKENLITTK